MKSIWLPAFCLLLSVGGDSAAQEAFRLGTPIPSTNYRRDPHPKWVAVKWEPEVDAPFLAIRREVDAAAADVLALDREGKWAAKARAAFDTWMKDCQSPVNLYRVSAYLGTARLLDPSFPSAPDFHKMNGYVDTGWSVLREPPNSYEFARRGYLTNSGDGDHHVFGDLPFRLLDKDPLDRNAVVAMVYEYVRRKPVEKFEQVLFAALERVSKTPRWRPWDDYNFALAYRMYGKKHKKVSAYEVAIKKAERALANTPEGWDSTWIEKWIADTRTESKDPNFGRLPGGKYIDDLDPPTPSPQGT